jgi:putative transcriptional regulator
MSSTGKRLIKAAMEAAAIARGEKKPARIHVPPDIDVRSIRRELKLSQDGFAAEFGFTINQIRDWEQGRTRPLDASKAYLLVIKRDPKRIRQLLKESSGKPGKKAA